MEFDVETAAFTAEFTYSTKALAYSTAYLNREYWYPAGVVATIMVNDTQEVDIDTVSVSTTKGDNYYSFNMAKYD